MTESVLFTHCTTSLQGILKSLSYKVELMRVQAYFCGMERRYESDNSFLELQVIYQIKFLDSLFADYERNISQQCTESQGVLFVNVDCVQIKKRNESNSNVKSNS